MSTVKHFEACPKCRNIGRDSSGDNLAIYHDGSVFCFACGYYKRGTFTSLLNPKRKENDGPKSLLPADFQREIPQHGWKWLLQWGLPYSHWQEITGYSPAEDRLIFRIKTDSNTLAFSTGRYLGTGEGLERQPRKWFVWGDPHKVCYIRSPEFASDATVLVEDLISGHKVGTLCETITLFGTKVHPCHLYTLRDGSRRPVVLWLDMDQWGSTYKTAAWLSGLVNRPVFTLHTKDDPKGLTQDRIQLELDKVLCTVV